ncbi:hypothetical protein J15TS10_29690 [Paenibacillus woosongensis]|uniref:Uncharacterized protein n=1 Tax=Paenibacillus woosongensis TaxID=307580 RepID=A0ABQ4MTB7_9BACL|nr:hypothetical protein J15TS10_29690 [Paenibacillus woosongensis]
MPRTNLSAFPKGTAMQERLCTSRVTPVCGSPEGCQALGALPYGKGGFERVETKNKTQ